MRASNPNAQVRLALLAGTSPPRSFAGRETKNQLSPAPNGMVPNVDPRMRLLAVTRFSAGTRRGIMALRGACPSRLSISKAKFTTTSIPRSVTKSSAGTRRKRPRSEITTRVRRSKRSVSTPTTAPNTSPGMIRDNRASSTPVSPAIRLPSEMVANMVIQSPELDTTLAHQNRANLPDRIIDIAERGAAAVIPVTLGEAPGGGHRAFFAPLGAGRFLGFAGPLARRSSSSSMARSRVMPSTVSATRSDALVSPSVT